MSSTLGVEEAHDILSVMEKNLECPICLDLMKEPVTTKCDHIFCRFCMLKLLNKKKKGFAQCPMCKHEVTKRSLQESPRFRMLVEGLLATIRAFELDTGLKFSCRPDNTKMAIETYSSEQMVKGVGALIQSTGYRNRRKRTLSYEQDNPVTALKNESNLNLKKDLLQISPWRSKRSKCTSGNPVYMKFGSESCEDLLEKAGSIGIEEKDSVQTPYCLSEFELQTCEERDSGTAEERLSLRPDAEEMIPSDLAEYDFSEREIESSKDVASRVDDFRTTASSLSEMLVPKKCGTAVPTASVKESNFIALHSDEEYSGPEAGRARTIEMPFGKKEDGSKRRSSSRNKRGNEQESSTFKLEFDCSYEKESSSPPDLPDSSSSCSVSKKRARISMQRVNDWLSKLDDEMFTGDSTLNIDPEPLLFDEEKGERDADSLASDKTEIMVSPLDFVPQHEHDPSSSKPTVATVEQQIFGKTYKRERKSNLQLNLSFLNESKSIYDFTMGPDNESNNVTTRTLRRRKKTIDLQPEDFILKVEKTNQVIDGIPKGKDVDRVAEILHKIDGAESQSRVSNTQRAVVDASAENKGNKSPPKVQLKGNEVLSSIIKVDGKPVCKIFHEQVKGNNSSLDPIYTEHNQTHKAVIFPVQDKRGKALTRRTRALELVSKGDLLKNPHEIMSDAMSLPSPCNQIDLQIESFPSSEEPNKAANSPKTFRRSRRLQLFNEENTFLVKPGISSTTGGEEDQARTSEPFIEGEKVDPSATCVLSEKYENHSASTSESKCIENTLNCTPEKGSEESNKDFDTLLSEKNIEWSPVVLHNESEEDCTQTSASLLSSLKNYQTIPSSSNVNVNPACLNSGMSSDGLSNNSPVDLTTCNRNKRAKSQSPHLTADGLTTKSIEVEDSELETEYLLRTFKGAKRKSFILHPDSPKDSTAECCVPLTSRDEVCTDKDATNGKAPHDSSAQNGQVAANSLIYDYNELQPDATDLSEKDLSNVESEVICPTVMEANMASSDKGQLKCSAVDVCGLLPLDVVESSFRNIFKGNSMASDSHNTGDIIVQGTDSHTINETELSDGPDWAGKNKVSYKPPSMHPPLSVSHHDPTEACLKVTSSETSPEENEPIDNCCYSNAYDNKGNPLSYPGRVQESIVVNHQKQTGAATCSATNCTPGLSVTPDGLLGSSSACDVVSKGSSGLSGKILEDAKLQEGNIEGNSSGSSIARYKKLSHRHSALKLFSSESSGEEDLPCFQALLFGDAFHPSLDSAEPNNSTNESSVKQQGGLLMSSSSGCEQEQEVALELSKAGCASPSQESECSVDLFSSQSNASETSAKGKEETKQAMPAVCSQKSHLPETKEPEVTEAETALVLHQEPRTDAEFDCANGKGTDQPLGDCSEYESEASHTGDSSGLSSQSEVLNTQQRHAMQNNLEKLQKEMAALQAVLEQNETQDLESESAARAPQQCDTADCSNGQDRSTERGTMCMSTRDTEGSKNVVSNNYAEDEHNVTPSYAPSSQRAELDCQRSPTPPPTQSQPSKRKTPERVRVSLRILEELKQTANSEGDVTGLVATDLVMPHDENGESGKTAIGMDERLTGPRRSSARVLSRLYENIGITPNRPCRSVRTSLRHSFDHANDTLVSPCITSKDHPRNPKTGEQKTLASTFVSPARNSAVSVMMKTPVVASKRKISMVASGLNQTELLLVQKFSSKTQSTLFHQITDETTHVIMKTDADLVCERTLKYFLGIAGRKWVISYQWIVQCFKEGRILDEVDFEVKGDIINGRNHGGPRRARLIPDGMLWKDFEICCYGSFTDMTTEHLEWMVKLCGGSVVKQLDQFTHKLSTAVVVVQPDACPAETDFEEIVRVHNIAVVTREWMLDSVARYECQSFDDYLLVESS